MPLYDLEFITDTDAGRVVNVWAEPLNNMAEALEAVVQGNANILSNMTDGMVTIVLTRQASRQAAVANFIAEENVRQMYPEIHDALTTASSTNH